MIQEQRAQTLVKDLCFSVLEDDMQFMNCLKTGERYKVYLN